MNIRRLGRSDLQVSELCLGTANFGWGIDEAMSFDLLDAFRESGGNFIQTCGTASDDTEVAESYLGRWVQSRRIQRGELVIAARYEVPEESGDIFRTASAIRRRCEASLRQLGLRYLDLLILDWSEQLAMDEVLLAAETLVRAGLVRHFAVSGFPTWRVMEWVAHSARRNLCRIEAMQIELSLVSNAGLNLEAMALARAHRVGLVARAPLAGGLLAGRSLAGRAPAILGSETLSALNQIADMHTVGPGRVAVAWVLAHPDVSSVLIGPRTVAQLEDHISAASLALTFSQLRRLDWLWRTTAGPATDDDEGEADIPNGKTLNAFQLENAEITNV